MDAEIPVLSGHLIVPTQSGFSINRISKKKSTNLKYCLLFRSSRHGIERLEICDSKEDTKNSKIITLENCVKITQDPTEKLINIVTKTGTLNLNTQNEEDLTNWVTVLKSVAFKDKNNTISRTSAIEEDNDLYCSSYNDGVFTVKLIPTETTVRCNLETGLYNIELTSTEIILRKPKNDTTIIAKWPYRYIRKYGYRDGKFTFEAGRKCDTGEGIFRLDHPNPQQIFRCMSTKMKTMKKLIKGDSMNSLDCGENQLNAALSMEAGSRSPLPPSPNNNQEFDVNAIGSPLNQSSNSLHTGFISSTDSLNLVTTPNGMAPSSKQSIPNKPPRKILIENCKVEPKSSDKYRKFQNYEPVTPSPTSSSSGSVLKVIADNTLNLKSNNNNNNNNLTLVIPSEISKRMQNNINNNNSINNNNNNNNSNKDRPSNRDYESIENITEAWKTLGIDEVKHTEHVTTPEDELVEFVWQRCKSQKELSRLPTPPINDRSPEPAPKVRNSPPPPPTHHPPPPPLSNSTKIIVDDNEDRDENYDHLEFFATSTKISSSYKTIITVVPPTYRKQTSQPVTHNDYELIGGPDTQSCRLADDSYLGYGVLRKSSLPGQIISNTTILHDDGLLDHRQCNGLDYAIVSKPKRV